MHPVHKLYKAKRALNTVAKDSVKSGVTFNRNLYSKLDKIVQKSKHYKIDKSEIINMLLSSQDYDIAKVQKAVIAWRKKNE